MYILLKRQLDQIFVFYFNAFLGGNIVFSNLSKPFFNPFKGKRLFFFSALLFRILHATIKFACSRSSSHFRCLSFVTSETCKLNSGRSNTKSMAEKERFPVIQNRLNLIELALYEYVNDQTVVNIDRTDKS